MGWNGKSIHLIRKPKQDEKPVVEKAKKVKVQPEVVPDDPEKKEE